MIAVDLSSRVPIYRQIVERVTDSLEDRAADRKRRLML